MSPCAVRVDRRHVYRNGFRYLRQFLDFNAKRLFTIDRERVMTCPERAEYRRDAEEFHKNLTDRFGKFGLDLAEEKTRVMRFGRFVCHDASISVHAVLLHPAGISSDHRRFRSPTVAF
jgi:hypothetical protein